LPEITGNSVVSVTLGEMTLVKMCDQDKPFGDLRPGDEVTVTYHEEAGRLYADSISLSAPLVACLLNEQ